MVSLGISLQIKKKIVALKEGEIMLIIRAD